MLDKNFVPRKPFPGFKWKWASLQCTEGINDPVVLLGVLLRMRKLEGIGVKYSSPEFAKELVELSEDIKDTGIGVDLARRTGERNIIRNSGQYWRAVGLLESSDHSGTIRLTDFGRKVADHEISQTEFAAITIQTFCLPNPQVQSAEECALWTRHGIQLHPLRLLLEIECALHDVGLAFITIGELVNIVIPLSGCGAELQDYVNFIGWFRAGELSLEGWPNCCEEANDVRIAREYLLFLENYGYVFCSKRTSRWDEKYSLNTLILDEIRGIISGKTQNQSLVQLASEIRESKLASELERKRVLSTRTGRPNQAAFRRDVLKVCQRCVITNVTMPEILEAAHIKPFKYKGEDTIGNGFAMRTDIHTLFDTGHLRINVDGVVELSQRARMDYGAVIPPRIVIPDFINRDFVRWRWENYNGL